MEIKPGYLTTEFWATVLNAIAMFVVAFGAMSQEEVNAIIGLALPLVGAVLPIVAYIWSRAKVKAG